MLRGFVPLLNSYLNFLIYSTVLMFIVLRGDTDMRIYVLILLVCFLTGCGGMVLEFGGMKLATGSPPDPMARGVFGPNQEPIPFEIIRPQPEIRYEQQRTTTIRRRAAPRPVLPPPTPCPTANPAALP